LAVRVAGAANIILREAIGVGQSISRRAFQVGRGSAGFYPLGGARPSVGVFWQDFSRLSPRLSAAKISHNSDFLMKSLITKGELERLQSLV
jgi:hypothetical protein